MADLSGLMVAHTVALAAWDALTDEQWDERSSVASKAVNITRDEILDHRPSSLEEVAEKAAYMAATRSFASWDDFDQIKLILALTPALEAQT